MNNDRINVKWLESIPENWRIMKLKYLCEINTGSKDTQDKLPDGKYPFFVRSPQIESLNEYTHDEEAVLTVGDGVGVGKVFHYYVGKFAAHQRVYVFTKFKNVIGKYIYYYLMSNLKFEVLMGEAKSTVDSIRRPMLTEFPVIFPNIEHQKKIVDFLDKKVNQINNLIELKEKYIILLEQQRQAIITEAITKGLNPNVKMKDSGVEWIGEIPEHWEIKKLKYIGEAITGLTYSPEDLTDESGTLVLRSTNIQKGKILLHDNVYVNKTIPSKLLTKKGDILICSRNGSRELIGKNALINDEINLSFGAFTTVFRSNFNYFIYYVLNSDIFEAQLGNYLTSTINQLTIGTLNNMEIPFAPVNEQREIAKYLNKVTKQYDLLINNITNQIEKLKEYRQSLIYEAVTGKIDVRDMELD